MIDGDQLLKYSPLLLTVGQIIMGWLMWRLSRVFALKVDMEKVRQQQDQLSSDVHQVRADHRLVTQRLDQLPTHKHLSEVQVELAKVAAVVPELKDAIKGLTTYTQIFVEADRRRADQSASKGSGG